MAREMFDQGNCRWCGVLIGALAQQSEPLAYSWVERCVRELLPLIDTQLKSVLLADLDLLAAMQAQRASQEEFWRRAEEIWYRLRPDQVEATVLGQVAVSKLFWAAGCEFGPRPEGWRFGLEAPVSVLFDCSSDPGESFETCLAQFERVSKSGAA